MSNIYFKQKSLLFVIGFFCFHFFSLPAQDQRVADSLAIIYGENKLDGVEKLELLKDLAFNEMNDLEQALNYANELIELSESMENNDYLYSGHLQKGYKYFDLDVFDLALTEFYECIDIARNNKNITSEGVAYLALADLFNKMNLFEDAEENFRKAMESFNKSNNLDYYSLALVNMGDMYFKNKDFDKALEFSEESMPILKSTNYLPGIAYNLGNKGMVYTELKKDSLAEVNLTQALEILEDQKDYYAISTYLLYLSEIKKRNGDITAALNHSNRSLELAKELGLKTNIRDAYLKLSELNKYVGNSDAATNYYENYRAYNDSINNFETERKISNLRVQQKQAEKEYIEQKKKNQSIILYATASTLLFIILLSVGLYRKNKYVRATNKIISSEKQRSDNLLLNILPEETAQELKDKGKVQAKRFESVTILFTDFAGFTKYSEHLPPEEVVATIDFYFSKFDEIIEEFGLEKIKTVGDAYMCAGGLPIPTDDHAYKVVLAATEIMKFVSEIKSKTDATLTQFDIRIGINTGPVVAGVVGSKKFAYDIWGDSVNIASRMESSSEPGKINITENTYELVKDKFNCKFRGKIEVKNRGELKMYFVESQIIIS